MTDMLAAYLVEPGKFDLRMVPMPEPKPDEVLVRVNRTGICGTDLHIFHGNYAADKLPMVPGHEFCGEISELGSDVSDLQVGASVVVDMNIGCTKCYWCRRNEVLNCPEMQQIGITMDGAFAEYIAVPARLVIPAPEHVHPKVLSLTEPLACVVRAARKARVEMGQSVVVMGAGPIGNLHVQLLRTIGAAPIIVSDIDPTRLETAKSVGADFAVAPDNLSEAVMQATNDRGADIVIESVGSKELYETATKLMRKGGHLAAFGLTGADDILPLNIIETILEENSIKGSVAGMGQDMHDALTLLSYGRINAEPFCGAEFPLQDIQSAFDTYADRKHNLKTQIVM